MGMILFAIMHLIIYSSALRQSNADGEIAFLLNRCRRGFATRSKESILLDKKFNTTARSSYDCLRRSPSTLPLADLWANPSVYSPLCRYWKALEKKRRRQTTFYSSGSRSIDEMESFYSQNVSERNRRQVKNIDNGFSHHYRKYVTAPGTSGDYFPRNKYDESLEEDSALENIRKYLESLSTPDIQDSAEEDSDPEIMAEDDREREKVTRRQNPKIKHRYRPTTTATSLCGLKRQYEEFQSDQCDSLGRHKLILLIILLLFCFIILGLVVSLYILFYKFKAVCTCCKVEVEDEFECYKMFENTDLDIEKNTQMIRELKPCCQEEPDTCRCSARLVTGEKLFKETKDPADDLLLEVASRKTCLCPCPKPPCRRPRRVNNRLLSLTPTESNTTAPSLKTQIKNASKKLLCLQEDDAPKAKEYVERPERLTKICPISPRFVEQARSNAFSSQPHTPSYSSSYSSSTSYYFPA